MDTIKALGALVVVGYFLGIGIASAFLTVYITLYIAVHGL